MSDISMDLYLAYEDGYKKGKAETEAYLLHCGDVTPVTNADLIRLMTDEELAELCSCIKRNYSLYPYSKDVWLEWMKQEVDDGRTNTHREM